MVGSLRFRLKKKKKIKKKSSPTRVDLDFGVHSQIDMANSDFFFSFFFFFCKSNILIICTPMFKTNNRR